MRNQKDEPFDSFLNTLRATRVFKNIEKEVKEIQESLENISGGKGAEDARELITRQRDIIGRQHKLLEKVMGGLEKVMSGMDNSYFGRVVTVLRGEDGENQKAVIRSRGGILEASFLNQFPVSAGELVKLTSKLPVQIIEKADQTLDSSGEIWTVRKIENEFFCEVENRGDTRYVLRGLYAGKEAPVLEVGHRVVLDESRTIIIGNLGAPESRFRFNEKPDVTWDDIGGQDKAKAILREIIEDSIKYRELYEYHGKKLPNGVLLYGAPGCGKTLIGKAMANAAIGMHGGEGADTAFVFIKAPEILEKYVGESEKTIKDIFEGGRKHFKKYGYRQIAFFDEGDAIFYKRGTGKSSDVERTIVPMFLSEMDGMDAVPGPIVIIATNQPQLLDPAIVRHNRMDIRIEVKRPTRETAVKIFEIHLKKARLELTREEMAVSATEELFSSGLAYWEIKKGGKNDSVPAGNASGKDEKKDEMVKFTLGDMVDGAMIAAVVEEAKSIAFQRDKQAGTKSAVSKKDMREAVRKIYEDSYSLEQTQLEAIKEFTNDFQDGVPVRKLKLASA